MPVLGNAFGSMKRLEIGLEMMTLLKLGNECRHDKDGCSIWFLKKIKKLPELSKMTASFPKQVMDQ